MLTSINIDNVTKLERFHTNNMNTRSTLYTDNKYIYKILDYKPTEELINIIKHIEEKDYDFIIKPKHLIMDKNRVVGYSTIYLPQQTMHNLRNRPLEKKKKDLLKAFGLIEKIADSNLVYHDFHTGNILVDNKFEKLTLCDLDCIRRNSVDDEENNTKHHYLRGLELLLEYYYNIPKCIAHEAIYHGGNIKYDRDDILGDCIHSVDKADFKNKVRKIESMNTRGYRRYKRYLVDVYKDRYENGYIKAD